MTAARTATEIASENVPPRASSSLSADEIAQRTAGLERVIEEQKRARAAATISRKAFDPSKLISAEAELAALGDAESELRRRKSAEEAREAKAAKKRLLSRLKPLSKAWIASIDEAEAMARGMAAALSNAEKQRQQVQGVLGKLGSEGAAFISAPEQTDRRARNLSALIRAMTGTDLYGDIRLAAAFAPADQRWAAPEQETIERLTGDLENGEN